MPSPRATSRFRLCIAMAGLAGLIALALAPTQVGLLVSMGLMEGVPLLLWLLAAYGIGTLAGRGLAFDVIGIVTRIALGLGAMSILTMLLGTAGLLQSATAWTLIVGGLVLAVRSIHAGREELAHWFRSPAGGAWWTLPIACPLAVLFVGGMVMPGLLWGGDDPAGYDAVAYHLQMPREWFERGRIAALDHNVFGYMPLSVEMHYLLAMHLRGGAYAGMFLAQLMHGAFIVLTIAGVYGVVRRHGRIAAASAAVVCAATPWMFMLGSVAYNEGGLMLYATLAAAWALRGRWGLAGAMAGLAAGCKLTGVTSAMLLVPIVVGVYSLSRRGDGAEGRASPARGVGAFALIALLAFSPWLIRTAIATGGNPIFPLAAGRLGSAHFDEGQVERFAIAHAPRPDQRSLHGRATALWRQVGGDFHYGSAFGTPFWFALLILPVCFAWRERAGYAWLALVVGNGLIWMFATHLQGRFLVQIIPCVAILVGLAVARRPAVLAPIAVGVAALSACVSWPAALKMLVGERGMVAAMGVEPAAFRETLPPDVAAAIYESDRPLVLVGDAKAFLYPVPSARLRYRSVFDVPSGKPFAEAWLGADVPADAAVIVDPSELERFERTYQNLPAMPASWRGRTAPFVVTAADVRAAR